MEISLLLMQQIAQLFLILIMGYAVVKVGLLKASDSRVLSVVMVYPGKEEVEKEIALDIKAVQLYEITIEHLTGKQIQEK